MNQADLSQFVQFFTLADTEAAQRITARLTLVLDDPTAYQKQFAEELEERGIVAALPAQELRDLALIDALLSEELLWEIDWNDQTAEIVLCLNEILTQQRRAERLDEPGFARHAATGPEALDVAQELMEPLGLALVLFTIDSDSYPLSVVAEAQAEETRRLAKALGFELAVY